MRRMISGAALTLALLIAVPTVSQTANQPPQVMPTPGVTSIGVPAPFTQNLPAVQISSDPTFSVGTLAGEVLTWATLAFGSILSSFLTAFIIRLLKNAGIQGGQLLSEKLNGILLNGINAGAAAVAKDMAGKGQVEIKNEIVAKAVAYTQAHGADTIKALGLDPNSGTAVEAIKARIETAIADPAVPTPAVLDAPAAPAKA